jgi:hypothetical protein
LTIRRKTADPWRVRIAPKRAYANIRATKCHKRIFFSEMLVFSLEVTTLTMGASAPQDASPSESQIVGNTLVLGGLWHFMKGTFV